VSAPEPAVLVENVGKRFRMPAERVHTLKERALHPLRRRYAEDLVALRDVSFAVEQGEFFGIVGRNGSGKSTLLKCLAGIYAADRGSIAVRGRLSTFIELGVGFNPDLAAADNIVLNGIMLGLSPREARRRVDDVIAFAELGEFADLKLKNYSSGMQVRLAFSVMIQVDADVLLIDEVLAVGDAAFQQKCFDVFNRIREEGRTVVFVTHDMGAVRRFCHRAMLIERGDVKMIGEPDEVSDQYIELNFGRDHFEGGGADAAVQDRLGDQDAQITDVWFEDEAGRRTDVLRQGAPCRLCTRVRFHRDADPNYAVIIEDDMHRPLFATSSADADALPGPQAAGTELTFAVDFDVVFAPGRIHVTPWLVHSGGAAVMDRLPRIHSAVVTGRRVTGGLVDLPHRMLVTQDEGDRIAADRHMTQSSSPMRSAPSRQTG
jgi:ABC-type polysaccharide/polyol phosphate transport system ATPase subunit